MAEKKWLNIQRNEKTIKIICSTVLYRLNRSFTKKQRVHQQKVEENIQQCNNNNISNMFLPNFGCTR